jgi:cell division protein ZapA
MSEAAVQLKVAGQTYQVVTSAEPAELNRLAKKVEGALYGVTPEGRQPSPQALVLAAITLAHELEEERARRIELEERHRQVLESLLSKVDRVLLETADFKTIPRASTGRSTAAVPMTVAAHSSASTETDSDSRPSNPI